MENAKYFDLQLFAEDAAAENTEATASDEQMEVEPEKPDTKASDNSEKEPEVIPDELKGLPDDVAKAAMDLAKAEAPEDKQDEEPQEEEQDDSAGQTSDTKNVDGLATPNQKIPYNRFKQEVDKRHELEQALEAYRQKFGDINGQQPQPSAQQAPAPAPQPMPQQPVAPQPQLPQFTPDSIKLINEAAQKQAIQMTGLTQDDIDAMEYMDDDDPKKQTYQYALETAKANIRENIRAMMAQRQQDAARFMRVHQESVNDYNNFYQEQAKDPQFEAIKNYAVNEYFTKMPPSKQQTVAASYARIERNVASPAEIQLVMDYFRDAKAAFNGGNKKANNQATKVKQASAMPRASQVDGTAGGNDAVTEATLKQMLDTMPFDKIPEKYQKMLLTGRIG